MYKIDLDGGKYTFCQNENGVLCCDKYGEPWIKNFTFVVGGNAVYALFHRCIELEKKLKEIRKCAG